MEKILCTKCSCEKVVKNGLMQGNQRYKCKDCGFNFTILKKVGVSQTHRNAWRCICIRGNGISGN